MAYRLPVRSLAWVAPLLFLSGCLGEANAAPSPSGSVSNAPPLRATGEAAPPSPQAGLGAIYVLITNLEAVPVEAAQVVVADTDLVAFTDAAGRAAFNDLTPGSYTVLAAKPGYRSIPDKGRLVTVNSDEVAEAKLQLDPAQIVTASNAYNKTLYFRGFFSCGWELRVAGNTARQACGRGVVVGGQNIGRDPNENSVHAWQVENIQIQTILSELKWQPTTAGTSQELFVSLASHYSCSATACSTSNEIRGKGGRSPVYHPIHEGQQTNLTNRLGKSATSYPRTVFSEVRQYCGDTCVAALTLQQSYELWVTAFYGQEAPPGWSSLPKG